ncbi:cystathionine beta-synthase/cysteine synthase A [Psychromicrobium silvestre]|uniref:Cystathionine beta-synthase/cysteine synthase A n=1 Tax=Psychromicrobium silvestre TaxID=1645614 RepID=A0A7Y9S8B6_9MICC|nr:cysteine synthase family protein [Psychromicrobium silvestre]NYE96290.1 cystathionine beta-synthase/cysteine synthase A [Psychromicrobium silvestre]
MTISLQPERELQALTSVGNTPLLEIQGLALPQRVSRSRVLLKLESANPGGSIKDRTALSMVQMAEASGELLPGATIVESSSGNTGVGLALIGALTGHPVLIVTSQDISAEKLEALRRYGAEVIFADWEASADSAENPRAVAERMAARIPGAWRPKQFDNAANPDAHYRGTGPEIWRQTGGRLTHFVAAVGTGGTVSGTGAFLKEASSGTVRIIAADPEGSVYSGGEPGRISVDGVGNTWPKELWPSSFNPGVVDEFRRIGNGETYTVLHFLRNRQGLLLGPSSGLALAAARRVAAEAPDGSVIVAIAPDTGRNYLSKAFNPQWLAEQGIQIDPHLPSLPNPATPAS